MGEQTLYKAGPPIIAVFQAFGRRVKNAVNTVEYMGINGKCYRLYAYPSIIDVLFENETGRKVMVGDLTGSSGSNLHANQYLL